MADILIWLGNHWGYVTLTTTLGFAGTSLKLWTDLQAERRAAAADKREQLKLEREGDLHPFNVAMLAEQVEATRLKNERERLEIAKLAPIPVVTPKRYFGEVAIIASRLAWTLSETVGDSTDKSTIVVFQLMAHAFGWSKKFVEDSLFRKSIKDLDPKGALSSVAVVAIDSVHQGHSTSRLLPSLIAGWCSRAWDAHEKDPNVSVEVVYQAYRKELINLFPKGLPDSVITSVDDLSWIEKINEGLEKRNAQPQKIWQMAEKIGVGLE